MSGSPRGRHAYLGFLFGAFVVAQFSLFVPPVAGASAWRVEHVVGNGEALVDVSCLSPTRCVGVSIGSKQISISKDGGGHWRAFPGPRSATLGFTSLDCVKPDTCFATTVLGSGSPDGGAVVKSLDGGRHWRIVLRRSKARNPDYRMNDVSCVNANSCLVAGTTGVKGFIFFTTDGGGEWKNAQLPAQPASASINAVICATRSHCFAAQGGLARIYTSNDDGRDWSGLPVPLSFAPYETEKGVLTGITALSCGSALFCVAGGFIAHTQLQASTEPFKWVTRDGGATWNYTQPFAATGAKSPAAISVAAISCTSSADCELGLSYGYIYVTSDGGIHWRRDQGAPDVDSDVLSITCLTQTRCVVSVISNFPSSKLFEGSIWVRN